jgi:hypothetical protein
MAHFFRCGVTAVALGILLLCISCEKHPLGQMPEVQREQSDPATKNWSEESDTDKPVASPTPAEGLPHQTR